MFTGCYRDDYVSDVHFFLKIFVGFISADGQTPSKNPGKAQPHSLLNAVLQLRRIFLTDTANNSQMNSLPTDEKNCIGHTVVWIIYHECLAPPTPQIYLDSCGFMRWLPLLGDEMS